MMIAMRRWIPALGFILCFVPFLCFSQTPASVTTAPDSTVKAPAGFKVTILAERLGRTRHLVVTPQHDIYIRLARRVNGVGTLLLHEENDKAEVKYGFGNFGGTGVFLKDGYLYTSSNSEVFRYKLDADNHVIDTASPERIVTGLVDKGTHETKSIMMDDKGNMYIPIGCPSNSCQEADRQKGSMGIQGCPLLETAGGVWMFRPDKKDQTYADGIRYATGLRNVVGVDWNYQTNKLYVMQHGRDQLNTIFPDLYTQKDNAELPAECMYALNKGDNAGWPYIYYDNFQKKKMMAPEYGGDGKKEGSSEFIDPVAAFPAHTAPNAILFYTGNQFPERYRNGAFIAFHGSWNRAPEPQAGFFVVFQPFKDGKPSGQWEVFADNFSGSPQKTASGRVDHRPCGLAQGPDGSLYVTDDLRGTLYKITYNSPNSDKMADAIKPISTKTVTKGTTTISTKKPVVKPTAKSPASATSGKTAAVTSTTAKSPAAAGKQVYMSGCVTCHQVDGGGVVNMSPSLIKAKFVNGSKSPLISVVLKGLSHKEIDGETYSNPMPNFRHLTDKQIADVLTYIRSSFGNKASVVTATEVSRVRAASKPATPVKK
jgi:glucose/arabinose dehydrogenase/mono/diheme cytochrome c family protein